MPVQLPDNTRKALIESIRQFMLEEFEQDLGELRAGTILGFFLEELAPSIYNLAVIDAQTLVAQKISDLSGELYEPERRYWSRKP